MTTQELEEALVREKERAEEALGCDMCKKYARCLYCFSKDEYRCAKAHDRLMVALSRGNRKFPAYLLHEPPMEVLEGKHSAPQTAPAKKNALSKVRAKSVREEAGEPKEETVETIAHILSGYNMNALSEERTRELMKISAMLDSTEEDNPHPARTRGADVFAHTRRSKSGVPLFIIRKRKSK